MNQIASVRPIVLSIGDEHAGGFFAGIIRSGNQRYELIVAPRSAGGDHDDIAWHMERGAIAGAMSFNDGHANTRAMAEAGSDLAKWALDLKIAGHTDWYLPSRDELEMLYRAFKPTTDKNWAYRGDNPSSDPVGYAYLPDSPAVTKIDDFVRGDAEAFSPNAYWSSTQYAGGAFSAWAQDFAVGSQIGCLKGNEFRARAVRRLPI